MGRRGRTSLAGDAVRRAGNAFRSAPLGMEADEPGSMWESAGQIAIESRSIAGIRWPGRDGPCPVEREVWCCDSWPPISRGRAHTVEFNLSARSREQYASSQLDERGNRAIVRRAPGDRLRGERRASDADIQTGRTVYVGSATQPAEPGVRHAAALAAQLVGCAGAAKALWTADQELNIPDSGQAAPSVSWTINAPEQEGVYDLVVSATKRTLQDRLLLWPTVDERRSAVHRSFAQSAGARARRRLLGKRWSRSIRPIRPGPID